MLLGGFFKGCRLLLLAADDVLDAFRKLHDIAAFDIFADFCCALEIVEIGILIRKDEDRLVIHLRAQKQGVFSGGVEI